MTSRVSPPLRSLTAMTLLVAASATVLSGCGGSDEDAGTQTGTPSLITPSDSFTAPATPTEPQSPTVAVTTLGATPLGKTVSIDQGTIVTVRDLKRLTVEAHGPGETAGPAISFVVEVRNNSGKNVDLDGYAVTASYGKDTPAIPSNADPNDPLTGSLANGKSASGTYVFRVAKSGAETITVQVSSNTAVNIAIFRS